MCVIVASELGKMPSNGDLLEMEQANSDGVGLAWFDGDYLRSRKALKMSDLEDHFRRAEGCPYVLHFRLATHGRVAVENCHPFWLGASAVLAHNGIIRNYGSPKLSDTRDYIERRLPKLVGAYDQKPWQDLGVVSKIEKDIGSNKFAILDVWGDITIVNRQLGVELLEYPDIWFSNNNWQWRAVAWNATRWSYYSKHAASYYKSNSSCCDYPMDDMDNMADLYEAEIEDTLPYTGYCDFCSKYGTLHYLPLPYRDDIEENYLCRQCFGEWSQDIEP